MLVILGEFRLFLHGNGWWCNRSIAIECRADSSLLLEVHFPVVFSIDFSEYHHTKSCKPGTKPIIPHIRRDRKPFDWGIVVSDNNPLCSVVLSATWCVPLFLQSALIKVITWLVFNTSLQCPIPVTYLLTLGFPNFYPNDSIALPVLYHILTCVTCRAQFLRSPTTTQQIYTFPFISGKSWLLQWISVAAVIDHFRGCSQRFHGNSELHQSETCYTLGLWVVWCF